jgi:hypothetical protein
MERKWMRNPAKIKERPPRMAGPDAVVIWVVAVEIASVMTQTRRFLAMISLPSS